MYFHHLLKYTHFRRTRWNDKMCTDVCTRFGLDTMAQGQSRTVQTTGMRRSTQDKQVRLKMTWKDEPSSLSTQSAFIVCRLVLQSGVQTVDDTLSLPRPTCWFFSAFLKWFGQPFVSVGSHMRSVLSCWSKIILEGLLTQNGKICH